jgi:hypothetical protein
MTKVSMVTEARSRKVAVYKEQINIRKALKAHPAAAAAAQAEAAAAAAAPVCTVQARHVESLLEGLRHVFACPRGCADPVCGSTRRLLVSVQQHTAEQAKSGTKCAPGCGRCHIAAMLAAACRAPAMQQQQQTSEEDVSSKGSSAPCCAERATSSCCCCHHH